MTEFSRILIVTGEDAIHVIPTKISSSSLTITVMFVKNKKLMNLIVLDDIPLGPNYVFYFHLYGKFVMSGGKYHIYNSKASDDTGLNHYGVAFYQYSQNVCDLALNFVSF